MGAFQNHLLRRWILYLVFKEALNNALKYSNGTHVSVQLLQKSGKLKLIVHDNGKANKEKLKTSGLGLSNIEMRARHIQAHFSIDRTEGFSLILEKRL